MTGFSESDRCFMNDKKMDMNRPSLSGKHSAQIKKNGVSNFPPFLFVLILEICWWGDPKMKKKKRVHIKSKVCNFIFWISFGLMRLNNISKNIFFLNIAFSFSGRPIPFAALPDLFLTFGYFWLFLKKIDLIFNTDSNNSAFFKFHSVRELLS